MAIASGLLFSIPMIKRFTSKYFFSSSIPSKTSSALSISVRVSEVM